MPTERQQSLDLLADLLEALLRSPALSPPVSRTSLPSGLHPDVYEVMCNVEHFLCDDDLREQDANYKERQEEQMRNLINDLRRGAPLRELMRHNFL